MIKTLKSTLLVLLTITLAYAIKPSFSFAQDGGLSGITFNDDFTIDDEDFYDDTLIIEDPFENYNRFMFNLNDKVYRHVFSPLAKGYDFLVPRKVQGSVDNFIRFSSTPKRFFNNAFQKKPKSAFIEFERFLINASLGIGGLFDPAKGIFNLSQQNEDFGQTLGAYNVDAGPYFIWPIVGPSTRRDTIGFFGDAALSPFLWFGIYDVQPEDGFRAIGIVKRVNNYSYNVRGTYDRVTESAIDPYIALQNAFIQNRNKNINK